MTTQRRSLVLGGAALVAVLVVLGVALLVGGGDPAEDAAPTPTPMTEPNPEPAPEPITEPAAEPVAGEVRHVEIVDLSAAGSQLFHPGHPEDEPVPVDEAAVDALVEELRVWLDDALTAMHAEGEVGDLADGLAGPEELLLLGDPDHDIVEARYLLTIGARGTPEWAEALVRVARADGSVRAVRLALLPGSPPVLVAAGPADAEAPEAVSEDEP